VNVFPNPTRGEFNVKLETTNPQTVSLQVYDATGALVYSKSGINESNLLLGSKWASGLYILQVQQGKQSRTLRLVKE
jgi:hypothetical protein